MKLTKRNLILITILIFIFLLIYSPHFNDAFPKHIDEWHHITESIKLKQGQNIQGISATESGFHIFLALLSSFTNIILIYKFLPAIWATLTALILFIIIKYKTSNLKKSFFISLFTIIFFASIKSNVNLTGLWFFTPLTFSIPFIYLYIYFFSEGIRKQNKKMILYSFLIMIFLIPIHSISVLFSIPFLIIFSLFNYKYLKKEYKFFSIFIIIPIIGIFFFSNIMNLSFINSIRTILTQLQFKHGFGVLEIKNSFFELYSPIGYLLSILGIIHIISSKAKFKKYLIYLLWPLTIIIYIIIFRLTDISFLSPYQRNLYYLAISLPFLSSLGLYYLIIKIKKLTNNLDKETKKTIFNTIITILIILILLLTFISYYKTPDNIKLYKTIDNNNYEAIQFLSSLPKSKIMAPALISTAIFPISNHQPVATTFFYGNRTIVEQFFRSNTCQIKNQIIKENKVSYVLSENSINCNWKIIYNKNNNLIYKV